MATPQAPALVNREITPAKHSLKNKRFRRKKRTNYCSSQWHERKKTRLTRTDGLILTNQPARRSSMPSLKKIPEKREIPCDLSVGLEPSSTIQPAGLDETLFFYFFVIFFVMSLKKPSPLTLLSLSNFACARKSKRETALGTSGVEPAPEISKWVCCLSFHAPRLGG